MWTWTPGPLGEGNRAGKSQVLKPHSTRGCHLLDITDFSSVSLEQSNPSLTHQNLCSFARADMTQRHSEAARSTVLFGIAALEARGCHRLPSAGLVPSEGWEGGLLQGPLPASAGAGDFWLAPASLSSPPSSSHDVSLLSTLPLLCGQESYWVRAHWWSRVDLITFVRPYL